ncbi:MAG: hypothetical protein QG592_464 [Pseudomonadota bacterium]|nr:hypothetical protein [Pseudomonadota bacterium]
MNIVKTAEEIGKLHALCEKAFADESGYGEVHSLSDRGIYRTFRDGFFAANRVLGKELRAELATEKERHCETLAAEARLLTELAELRARAEELERQVRDKHEAATVDEICNAYESGVGHRGRPTANVNPYRQGSDLATAYNIGALGDRESPAAAAVPDDVAKDVERYRFLKERSPFGNRVPHIEQYPYQPKIDRSEFPHFTVVGIDEAIDAAILAADAEGRSNG